MLTILDNLPNEDGNLYEGKEVYDKGYFVFLAAHHAQLSKPDPTSVWFFGLLFLLLLFLLWRIVNVILHFNLGVLPRESP